MSIKTADPTQSTPDAVVASAPTTGADLSPAPAGSGGGSGRPLPVDLDAVRRQIEIVRSLEQHAEALTVECRAARAAISAAEVFVTIADGDPDFRYPLGTELLRRAIAEYDRVSGRA